MDLSQKHSGLGIASLAISLGGCFLAALLLTVAMSDGRYARGTTQGNLLAAGVLLGPLSESAALALGIAGLFQTGRNKVFAILGIALSSLAILVAAYFLFVALG